MRYYITQIRIQTEARLKERNQTLVCKVWISSGKVSMINPSVKELVGHHLLCASLHCCFPAVQPGKMNGVSFVVLLNLPSPLQCAHVDFH